MFALLAFTTAIFVGPEVAAPAPKAVAPVVSSIAASTAIGNDFLVAFVVNHSIDVQRISGTTGKPAHERATTLGTYVSAPVSVAIASNGTNAIVAWCLENDDIYVAVVDLDGKPLTVRQRTRNNGHHVALTTLGDRYLLVIQIGDAGGFLLDPTTADQIGDMLFYYPRTSEVTVASNGKTALVTFIGDRIVTFLVSRYKASAGPVFAGLGSANNVHSAWDGSEFIVAWNGLGRILEAKIAADGSVTAAPFDASERNAGLVAIVGSTLVLGDWSVAGSGPVIAVAPNGSTNLAIFSAPQLSAAITNFTDTTTPVAVALSSLQSSPSISAGLTQFFAGWAENDRTVVAPFANHSFSSFTALPPGQIGVAATDDGAMAVTIDATSLTTHAIASDGALLRSTRIAEGPYSETRLATLQRNGDLFGALLTPKPEFLVLSERAVISGVPLPAFPIGCDLAAIGDHWVAGYYWLSGGTRFDDLSFLGRTLATRARIQPPYFPSWMAMAADDRGDLLVALPYDGYVLLSMVDPRGNVRAVESLYEATRAHVAWSGSEFVVVAEGWRVDAWLFDRDGNMTANPVAIPMPLQPRELRLAAGPAGMAIAYVRGDPTAGDGDYLFVRQIETYTPHGRPAR